MVVTSLALAWGISYGKGGEYIQRGDNYGRSNSSLSDSPCWTKSYLKATPEQFKSLENLQRPFYKEISSLRNQYLNLQYELRARLEHPHPDVVAILEKQKQFSDLQKRWRKYPCSIS